MDNDIIRKQNALRKAKIANQFLDSERTLYKAMVDELEKGRKADIGEVRTWGGEKWRKEVDGWVHVTTGEKKIKMEPGDVNQTEAKQVGQVKGGETKLKGLGIFGDEHLYKSVRKEHTPESLTSAVKEILEKDNVPSSIKVVELFKEGLHIHEIVNVSGTPLSATIDYISKAKKRGEFDDMKTPEPESTQQARTVQQGGRNRRETEAERQYNEDIALGFEDIPLPEISVETRWKTYEVLGMQVCTRRCRAMMAYGSGGVGKTYSMLDPDDGVFAKMKMRKGDLNPTLDAVDEVTGEPISEVGGDSEDSIVGLNPVTNERFLKKDKYDYIVASGKVTPTRMFTMMQEHNGKCIVFDDCDSMLEDDDGVNILKGALDTTGDGTISWEGASDKSLKTQYAGIRGARPVLNNKGEKTGVYNLPRTFRFTGQICFLSNIPDKKIPQPLRSRSNMIDLTMNKRETLDKLEKIYKKAKFRDPEGNLIEVSQENRDKALTFLKRYGLRIKDDDFNLRTWSKFALMYDSAELFGTTTNPEEMITAVITRSNR